MGVVRRHPLVALLVVLLSVPVAALVALELAEDRPTCGKWRAQVTEEVARRSAPSRTPPVTGLVEGVPVAELREGVWEQVAFEMRETRPPLCHWGG